MINPKLPLDVVVTSDAAAINLDQLAEFSERAWRHDYTGQLRVLYDRDYYAWLLDGEHWFAVLASTETGQLVGCRFSLLRTLHYEGEFFPTAYSTAWAVDPAYRRTGVSLRLWQANRATLLERGYIGVSTSHVGHTGTRLSGVLREPPGQERGVSIAFHTGAIWSKRHPVKVEKARSRILTRQLYFSDEKMMPQGSRSPIDNNEFAELVATTSLLCFTPSNNFAQLYMKRNVGRSGTILFACKSGSRCAVGFSTHTLAYNDTTIGLVGRIQFFLGSGCDDDDVLAVLESICLFLTDLGCISVSLVDQQCISHKVLHQSGFEETPDAVKFHIWAPESLAGRFKDVRPPSALDFL